MKQLQLLILMLCCLVLGHQTARAQEDPNTIVFKETFDKNTVQGGRDGNFKAGSGKPNFDNEGWTGDNSSKIYGANHCIRFGTDAATGTLISPAISVGTIRSG